MAKELKKEKRELLNMFLIANSRKKRGKKGESGG